MADPCLPLVHDILAATLGVEVHHIAPPYQNAREFDRRLARILRADFHFENIFNLHALHQVQDGTVYFLRNALEMNYAIFPLAGCEPREFWVCGPFLYEAMSDAAFARVLTRNHIGQSSAAPLRTFYSTVPEVAEPTMAAVAHAVACHLYGAHDPAHVVFCTLDADVTGKPRPEEAFQVSMELLERRYRAENAVLAAVTQGDYNSALRHLNQFSAKRLAPRAASALRDAKNNLIIANTLMRKAAENGGVHPVYLDQLSGALAVKIEHLRDTAQANRLMPEMLRRYCRLVRSEAHAGYSQTVRRALQYIHLHLSGELSLKSVAAALGFNATYLSAQFSRECGETLTSYIHNLRLQTARRLLDETDLPVAEIAARVGIVDVAYFSRLFKKKYGLSPLRHRAQQ